jgi:hypothetical protein
LDKTLEDQTERELEVNPQGNTDAKTSNFIQSSSQKEGAAAIKIKLHDVFKKSSMYWIIFKYSLLALPFLLFAIIFGSMELRTANGISNAVQIQSKIQILQQNINLAMVYALQHGTEDNQYKKQLDLNSFLSNLTSEIFIIQRSFVG